MLKFDDVLIGKLCWAFFKFVVNLIVLKFVSIQMLQKYNEVKVSMCN